MNAPLVPVTLAFLAGILLGTSARLPSVGLIVVGAASAGVALVGRRRARIAIPALVLLWVCAGVLRMHVWLAHPEHRLAQALPEEPRPVRLHAVVATDPVGVFDPEEPARTTAVLRLLDVREDGGWPHHLPGFADSEPPLRGTPQANGQVVGWRPIRGRLRATFQGSDPAPLAYGDEILMDGEWSRVPSPGNPGEYDWRAALARARIHGLLRVRPFDGLVVLAHGRGSPLLTAVFALRRRWERLIDAAFSARDAGLLRSLLLGERGPLGERLKQAFVETGTVHLVAREMRRNP